MGHHAANIDNWADNVFTYLKRFHLATNWEGTALSLDAVIRTLRKIDEAHFQRLSETLNVEQVFFAGAKGQQVAIYRPKTTLQPLTTEELVSLCHALLALVTPETYDRAGMGRQMTLKAIRHRNNLILQLTARLQQLHGE
eukprot:2573923-Amphidinium_carterae.1